MSQSNTSGHGTGPDPREALIAFDGLPAPLRRRLANATVQIDPTDLLDWYRRARRQGVPIDDIVGMAEQSIRSVEEDAALDLAMVYAKQGMTAPKAAA